MTRNGHRRRHSVMMNGSIMRMGIGAPSTASHTRISRRVLPIGARRFRTAYPIRMSLCDTLNDANVAHGGIAQKLTRTRVCWALSEAARRSRHCRTQSQPCASPSLLRGSLLVFPELDSDRPRSISPARQLGVGGESLGILDRAISCNPVRFGHELLLAGDFWSNPRDCSFEPSKLNVGGPSAHYQPRLHP